MVPLAIDGDGLIPSKEVAACEYVYVTPAHHCPTTVTMPLRRRERLLELARQNDVVIIEDGYEFELSGESHGAPALRSLDADGRVVYVGSFSKILAPGLRIGYVVAPAAVARELRALRRLMLRHPPSNNQRAAALFLGLGHYKSHLRRVTHALERARRDRRGGAGAPSAALASRAGHRRLELLARRAAFARLPCARAKRRRSAAS